MQVNTVPTSTPEQRIGKAGEQLDERGAVLERGHGAAHGGHAVHEHGETEQNVADVVFGQIPAEHAQHDADHGDDAVSVAVLSSDTQPEPLMSDRQRIQPVMLVPRMEPSTMPMA